jgi:hypothetical protein
MKLNGTYLIEVTLSSGCASVCLDSDNSVNMLEARIALYGSHVIESVCLIGPPQPGDRTYKFYMLGSFCP